MRSVCQFGLARQHISLMIVHRMQRGSRGRGYPGRVGPGPGVITFGLHHGSHFIGHGPHAFADLSVSRQATSEAHIHVPVFIGPYPGLGFHVGFAHHRAGFHRGVNLITGAIKKPGVDKNYTIGCGSDTFFQIDGRTPFFVHDADFHCPGRHAKQCFGTLKEFHRKSGFLRAMHFRLDHIHRAFVRIAQVAGAAEVVQGNKPGHHSIHNAFEDFIAFAVEDCRVGHQVADIAHQHQCPPR